MDKRYQIFISSTFTDLQDERVQVQKMLMQLDCIPAGMELFPAIDEEQLEFIKKIIDDSDYYLLIIGGRYGSVGKDGISYTEKEYDYAVSKNMKVIALLHENPASITLEKSERETKARKSLERFRKKVKQGRMVLFWNDASELPSKVAQSLPLTIKTYPATGWVRATNVPSHEVYKELNDLRKENDALRDKLRKQSAFAETYNIEGLEDKLTVEGVYSSAWADTIIGLKAEITWGDIFYLIAPSIHGQLDDQRASSILSNFALRVLDLPEGLDMEYGEIDVSYPTINDVRIQFRALDLIAITPTNKGVVWGLTPRGEMLLLINTAKRKPVE